MSDTIPHMERVQIQLSAEQLAALRRRSGSTGRSVAALVREAVGQWIAADDQAPERTRRIERAFKVVGRFRSGRGDIAEAHDRYLDEAFTE